MKSNDSPYSLDCYNDFENENSASDFFEYIENAHKKAIQSIKHMIDVDAKQSHEYKAAAVLCKFIFESQDKYCLIQEAEKYGYFYNNAQAFETLCYTIYHALTDDGDIAFVKVNKHCPTIVFQSRWDLTIDNLLSESEKDIYERLNAFKKEKNLLPLVEHEVVFFDDVYSYIEAVKAYRIDLQVLQKKINNIRII